MPHVFYAIHINGNVCAVCMNVIAHPVRQNFNENGNSVDELLYKRRSHFSSVLCSPFVLRSISFVITLTNVNALHRRCLSYSLLCSFARFFHLSRVWRLENYKHWFLIKIRPLFGVTLNNPFILAPNKINSIRRERKISAAKK